MPTRFDIEETVRGMLEDEFHVRLLKMRLPVGVKANGETRYHEFDCVSPDQQIVAEIKTNKLKASASKPNGRYYSAIKWALLGDVYMLGRICAAKKYLVLTDEPLFKVCKQDMDGILPENTAILLKGIE